MSINLALKYERPVRSSVYHAPNNKNYVVRDVPNISLLKSLGIRKNSQVYKKRTYRLGGPVLLVVDAREIALGKDIAEQIIVEEA
ncbi:MAG TPA: ferrous iron transport protein A [Clostridia bacterium]|nr:ferrous iron transport protein A [Clostridia bacterium]